MNDKKGVRYNTLLSVGPLCYVQGSDGRVCELRVDCKMFERGKMARKDRPRSFIHWVSNPLSATVRMFDKL